MDSYTLRRGNLGALRLQVLAQAAGAGTQALLDRLAWRDDWRCLDVGCGLGPVTRELARRSGGALGVDCSADFIERARGQGEADYAVLDVAGLDSLGQSFDVVYARYLLSHLRQPEVAVASLAARLPVGGRLVLEDVDFPGNLCDPPCPAFERYVELYQELVARRGGDARLGRRLWRLAAQAGLEVEFSGVHVALQRHGPEKRVAELTLAHIRAGLVEQGLATRSQVAALLVELRAFRRSHSQITLAPTFQVIARKTDPLSSMKHVVIEKANCLE